MLTYTFFMWVKHGCQESQISYFSTVSGWLLVTAQAIPPLTVSKINFLSAFYRLFQFWTTLSTEFIMIIILCTHSEKFQVPHIHNSYTHTHTHTHADTMICPSQMHIHAISIYMYTYPWCPVHITTQWHTHMHTNPMTMEVTKDSHYQFSQSQNYFDSLCPAWIKACQLME